MAKWNGETQPIDTVQMGDKTPPSWPSFTSMRRRGCDGL